MRLLYFLVLTYLCTGMIGCSDPPADIIFLHGEIYTMEPEQPWASAVAVRRDRIQAVFDRSEDAEPFIGPNTRVIDLKGSFMVPGLIDAHVHFNQAGALINDANLMAVADDDGLRKEMIRVTDILDDGEWITGGLWGAYEKWSLGAEGPSGERRARWEPNRRIIDDVTRNNPCLLNNYEGTLYLANTLALRLAGLENRCIPGMRVENGKSTGIIVKGSPALDSLRKVITPKSHQRLMDENRAALKKLAESGITEIHDIAVPEQTARFVELQENGELSCRVWLRPDLTLGAEMKKQGFKMGLHPKTRKKDSWLRYGALKGYIDGIMGTHGALFFEAYEDDPGNFGHYRRHTSDDPDFRIGNMEKMVSLIQTGIDAGFAANVHAIGDKGVSLMLDTYERLLREGRSLDGFRIIHAQVVRPQDFPRFKELNVIAEVNPYHISDDMRWMEERIGYERCKGAYAFRSLLDNGAILCFGSDWPGTSAAEYHMHPKYLIHAAVNRTTINHTPAGGWFPEQKISVHDALKAYTINAAKAVFEENVRGSIQKGKLADLTVIDRNLLEIDPEQILEMNIEMTVVGGKIVYGRSQQGNR